MPAIFLLVLVGGLSTLVTAEMKLTEPGLRTQAKTIHCGSQIQNKLLQNPSSRSVIQMLLDMDSQIVEYNQRVLSNLFKQYTQAPTQAEASVASVKAAHILGYATRRNYRHGMSAADTEFNQFKPAIQDAMNRAQAEGYSVSAENLGISIEQELGSARLYPNLTLDKTIQISEYPQIRGVRVRRIFGSELIEIKFLIPTGNDPLDFFQSLGQAMKTVGTGCSDVDASLNGKSIAELQELLRGGK